MRKALLIVLAVILGVAVAEAATAGLGYLIEDPRVQACIETGKIGDQPMPEGLAKIIGQQCHDGMEREGICRRFAATYNPVTVLVVTIVGRLLDPITLTAAALLSLLFAWGLLRARAV